MRREHLLNIKTPLFGVGGCNVGGWYLANSRKENGILDPPETENWFGNVIFQNDQLRVVLISPIISAEVYTTPEGVIPLDSFIPDSLEDFMGNRKTIAESMIGKTYDTDVFIYGDPTFHY